MEEIHGGFRYTDAVAVVCFPQCILSVHRAAWIQIRNQGEEVFLDL
jgi:hypothetical protein